MCALSNRPATPRGSERALNPVSLDALTPTGLRQAPVGIVMFDTERRIAWVNEAAERLIGGPPLRDGPGVGWARCCPAWTPA
jgi:PAS domain-containing protein